MGRRSITPLLDIHGPYPPDMRIINPYAYAAAGGGPPSLIASANNGSGGADSITSDSVDTTGANLIVVSVGWYTGSTSSGTLTDSKGNTWTALTPQSNNGGTPIKNQLYYCYAPTVGSGHTFTWSGTFTFPAISVVAFDNIAASPFDGENGGNNGGSAGSTVQTGSLTPSQANSLVITGLAHETNSGGSVSINGSFTIAASNPYGGQEGNAIAYLILTSATAQNPTWDITNSSTLAATIAAFKY